jgi:hypothetical protein
MIGSITLNAARPSGLKRLRSIAGICAESGCPHAEDQNCHAGIAKLSTVIIFYTHLLEPL